MKIAFSGFVFDHGKSGIGTYIKSLLTALSKSDQKNHYDLFFAKGEEKLFPPLSENFSWQLYPEFLAKPVPNILWHNFYLPLLTQKRDYDIIHVPSFRRIPYFKGKAKLIATVHDMAPLAIPTKYDRWRHFYHQKIQSRLIHRCDQVIAVSASTKRDIIRFTGYPEDKIEVIYNGYDADLYKLSDRQEAQQKIKTKYGIIDPFFIYISRIEHPGKNHLRLIEAFENFKRKRKTAHQLLLAGTDWSGAELVKKRVSQCEWQSDIHFLGFVPTEDLPDLYNACEAMVYPSLYEGFGLPIIEALACGAPVISSNTSSMQEVGGQIADYFDPLNVEEISQNLEKNFDHSLEKRQQRAKYASQFSWERAAAQVLEVYTKVTS